VGSTICAPQFGQAGGLLEAAFTSFESFLQNKNREKSNDGYTTFETHLKSMLGEKIDKPLISVNDGGQIIQRITRSIRDISEKSTIIWKNIIPNVSKTT